MSNQNEHGRYARMIAFWAIVLLVAYGCFHGGGLVTLLNNHMPAAWNPVLIEPFPLFHTLRGSTLVGMGVVLVAAVVVHRILAKPRIATALVDTEAEMKKVTWPSWAETWQGTMAVVAMVLVLFLFLTMVDYLLVTIAVKK